MVDKLNYTNILKSNYNFFSAKYFFGLGDDNYSYDIVRIIKLLYILISFILNLLIVIFLIIRKKKKFSIALILTGNILIINFIHTFSYSFEWILKEEDDNHSMPLYIMKNGTVLNNNTNIDSDYYQVGGLLIGNPNNFGVCNFQGFSLIFSALAQDVLIIIFFYIINLPNAPTKIKMRLFIVFGYFFPLVVAFIYLAIDGIGLNDKYCYIKKFDFEKVKNCSIIFSNGDYTDYNTCNVKYEFTKTKFRLLVNILYGLRTINLFVSSLFLYKIIQYVRLNKLKNMYILKLSAILIVQAITILLGLIYRIGSSIDEHFSRKLSSIFLCLNTLDGILFPLSYSLSNGVYRILFCGKRKDSKESLSEDEDEFMSYGSASSFLIVPSPTVEKTFAMVDVKDDNNFDLSYANN